MFVRVIPEPIIEEISFLIVLPIILSPASTRRLLFNSLGPAFCNSFLNEFATELLL